MKKTRAGGAAHYVHVNSHVIRKNRAAGTDEPPVVVRKGRSGKPRRGRVIEILDANGKVAARVVYEPGRPLSCGAQVYVICEYGARVGQEAASAAQSVRGRAAETGCTL